MPNLFSLLENVSSKLTIKRKLWLSFTAIFIVLTLVAVNAVWILFSNKSSISRVMDDLQPLTGSLLNVRNTLNAAASSLGFYLISKEDSHKDSFSSQLEQLEKLMRDTRTMIEQNGNNDLLKNWKAVETDIQTFSNLKDRMIEYAGDATKNFSAISYAGQNLNPISMEILQAATGMIDAELTQKTDDKRKRFFAEISELRYTWSNVMSNVRLYLNLGEDGVLENVNLFLEKTENLITSIKKNKKLLTFEQEEYIDQISESVETFKNGLEELVTIYKSDKARMDAYVIRTEISPLVERIHKNLDKIVSEQQTEMFVTGDRLVSQVNTGSGFAITMLLAGLFVGAIVIWALDKFTVSPLKKAVAAMEDVARGDGDLTKRLRDDGKDEIAQLARNFNDFVAKIEQLLHKSMSFIEQVSTRVDRLKVVSEETSKAANEQQTKSESTASAITEMAYTVKEVVANTAEAAKSAENANQETEKGLSIVQHTMDVINQMAQDVEYTAEFITKLEQNSAKIGSVLDVIRGVAEQTNLLALNAAIEAARAGDHGRGFAVVADEVRTLAARTQASAQEIQEMITNVQTGTTNAAASMEKTRTQAQAGVDQVAQAGSSLQSISQAVQLIHRMNTKIATSSEQQLKVVEEINANVVALNNIAETNAAGAQQTHSASNELAELQRQLIELMGQFNIESTNAGVKQTK